MNAITTEVKYDLMIMLSGPEPQRTILEEKLIDQLSTYTKPVLLVRGLPQKNSNILQLPLHITVHDHLPAASLQEAICSSQLIICRSGYTTLMDLIRLKKIAVLIPTPGQPEQEYLAEYIQQQQLFPFISQADVSLHNAITVAEKFSYRNPFTDIDFEHYKEVVNNQVELLTAE
jgi:predicted glycosyltransferase